MSVLINTKITSHKSGKRLWLEGQKLQKEGYLPGTRYNIEIKDSSLCLVVADNGDYIVSKRERNGRVAPIIDINNRELSVLFDGVDIVRVLIRSGKIVVSAHHHHEDVVERLNRIVSKIEKGESLNVCSLFHGGGILDKALHKGFSSAGFKTRLAVAVEIEADYLESSLRNNPELWDNDSLAIESPVERVDLSKRSMKADLLFAGIPCVGASKSGRSKNKLLHAESHESAGALFFSFLRFVEALQPGIVVIENVPDYQSTASMAVIRSVLGTLGYSTQERIFDGKTFGALEDRRRLCVVALTSGLETLFDIEKVFPISPSNGKLIQDILDDIPADSERWKSFSYLAEKEARDLAAGKGFKRQLLTGNEDRCGTLGRGYGKCRSTEPFLINPVNNKLSRIFTPSEHARLKGIPEDAINNISETTAHEILGQSIVFPVFESLGKALGESLMNVANVKLAA